MSNQANRYVEWMHALIFFRRQHPLLTVEERDLLDDWELVLCEVSTLEAVAFLPCLQRCFASEKNAGKRVVIQSCVCPAPSVPADAFLTKYRVWRHLGRYKHNL